MAPRVIWTIEKVAELRAYLSDGLSDGKISAITGRSFGAIRCKRQELGIQVNSKWRFGTWSDIEMTKFKRLYDEGLTDSKISDELPGRTKGAVHWVRTSLGLPCNGFLPHNAWTPDDFEFLREKRAAGWTFEAIAAAMDRTVRAVEGKYNRGQETALEKLQWKYDQLVEMYEFDRQAHAGQRYSSLKMKKNPARARLDGEI